MCCGSRPRLSYNAVKTLVDHLRDGAIRARFRAVVNSGMPAVVAGTLSVQGLTYLVQLALAPLLGPAAFGIVRSTEAIVASASLVAALGMPTLMMRFIAESDGAAWRAFVSRRILAFSAVAGMIVAILLGVSASLYTMREAIPFVEVLTVSVIATAIARTGIGYYLGANLAAVVPRYTVPLAALSAILVVGGTWLFGLRGWVGGRVAGDLLLALTIVVAVRRHAAPAVETRANDRRLFPSALAAAGIPLALSLVARTTLDNSAVLVLGRVNGAANTLGIVGLYSLATSALLLIPSAVVTLAFPRMVARRQRPDELARFLFRVIGVMLLVTIPPALLCASLAVPVLSRWLPAYATAPGIAALLMVTAAPRAITSVAGTVLLSLDRIGSSLIITAASMFVVIAGQTLATHSYGLTGLIVATLVGESATALVSLGIVIRMLRR